MGSRLAPFLIGLLALVPGQAHSQSSRTFDEAKRDLELLMSRGMAIAETALVHQPHLRPFAAAMTPAGAIENITADTLGPLSTERVIDFLENVLRAGSKEGRYKATAVFAITRATAPGEGKAHDVIQARLEHRGGYCVDMFLQYVVTADSTTFGTLFAGRRRGTVFPVCKK